MVTWFQGFNSESNWFPCRSFGYDLKTREFTINNLIIIICNTFGLEVLKVVVSVSDILSLTAASKRKI